MRDTIKDFFIGGEREKRDFKAQLKLLIVMTFGFTIAFTWRQTFFDVTQEAIKFFIDIQGSATLSILTSLTITLISIIIIYFASRFIET